ncbi:MAG: hypothetical protein U0Z44_00840 [Kouleothrix sp.]
MPDLKILIVVGDERPGWYAYEPLVVAADITRARLSTPAATV